jgi:uncharacterized protein
VDASAALLWILSVGLVAIGIVGTVVPALPGAVLVLAGLALAAWIDGFARVGLPTLAVLAALTAAAYALDFVATAVGTRRFGTSWWGVLGALLGTLVGLFVGLPGLVLGPFLGAFLLELLARRDLRHAGRAGLGAWLGLVLGAAGRLGLVAAMIAIFVVAYVR